MAPLYVLGGLLVLLTVVTLVGHGIWTLCAAVLRMMRQTEPTRSTVCPFCGHTNTAKVEEPLVGVELVAKPVRPPVEEVVFVDVEQVAEPVEVATRPRRSLPEMLAGFMEERNIRWGELVGGLLIVCSSIALVISLWETLEHIPYFQFFIFVSVSSAIFGVGLYTHYRWKLDSTSRGLLTIATLLVPLDFLAMASLSKASYGPMTLTAELASLAIFVWLVGLAAKVLVPNGRWPVVLAVVGNSAAVLLCARLLGDKPEVSTLLFACILPVIVFNVAAGMYILRADRPHKGDCPPYALFTFVGCSVFSLAVAIGIVVVRGAQTFDVTAILNSLSAPLAISAIPIVILALIAKRGVARSDTLAPFEIAATIVALVGVLGMLFALGLAWPLPIGIIVVGLVNSIAITWIAIRYRFPIAHIGTVACSSIVYLVCFHLTHTQNWSWLTSSDHGPELLRLCVSAPSGTALCGLFVVFAIVAELFARRDKLQEAIIYAGGCAIVAIMSLSLATYHGLASGQVDALRASILYGVYGVGSIAFAARWRKPQLTHLGLVLLAIGTLGLVWWRCGTLDVHWTAVSLLQYSTIVALLGMALTFWTDRLGASISRVFTRPVIDVALFGSAATAVIMLMVSWPSTLTFGLCLFQLSAVWLVLALTKRSALLMLVSQAFSLFGALVVTTAWLELNGTAEVDSLRIYGIGLILYALPWLVVRTATRSNRIVQSLLDPERVVLDSVCVYIVVFVQFFLEFMRALGHAWNEMHSVAVLQPVLDPSNAWLLLSMLIVAMAIMLWQRWRDADLASTLLIGVTAALLVACGFTSDFAVTAALRWLLSATFLILSVAVWNRTRLLSLCNQLSARIDVSSRGPATARITLLCTTVLPVVALTLVVLFTGRWLPATGTFFGDLHIQVSYLVPLLFLAVGLVGYALREKSAGYAFLAGLVVELIVTLGYTLHVSASSNPFNLVHFVTILELFALTAAAWGILWLAARRFFNVWQDDKPLLLNVQLGLPVVTIIGLLTAAVVCIVQSPQQPPDWITQLADPIGWAALLLTTLAVGWYSLQLSKNSIFSVFCCLLLGSIVLCTCYTVNFWESWLSYNFLTFCFTVGSLVVLAVGRSWPDVGRNTKGWVSFYGGIALILALLWYQDDPTGPWISGWSILALSVTTGLLAMCYRLPAYVLISCLLLNTAGTIVCHAWMPGTLHALVEVNVFCLAVGAAIWTLLRIGCRNGVPDIELERRQVPAAHLVIVAGLCMMGILVGTIVVRDILGHVHLVDRNAWIALIGLVVALVTLIWDRSARFVLLGFYVVGLMAIGMRWDANGYTPLDLLWTAATELGGFMLLTAMIGWLLRRAEPQCRSLRIPCDEERWLKGWFPTCQAIIWSIVAALGVWISMDSTFDSYGRHALFGLVGRVAGPNAALAMLGATIVMAWQSAGVRRAAWQYAAFASGLLLNCCLGWSTLMPEVTAPWFHRTATVVMASGMLTLVTGVGLKRFLPKSDDWITNGRRAAPWFGAMALVSLGLVFVQEIVLYAFRGSVPITTSELVSTSVVLVGLIVMCLCFAVFGKLDPLGMSDRRRTIYVYAAELLAVVLCVHFRLTMPWLFALDIFERYWMLILMAVAFFGAGLSEFFHRRGLPVLSEPLARTAMLLPLAPAVGFWAVDTAPSLWFLMTVFYGLMAVTRRSVFMAMLAVLTGNVGLCVLWHNWNLGFLTHPQLWLIPIALAALVAERFGESRLTNAQRMAVRYIALGVIYISSTADMFIAGLGESFWLPLILMFLSVLGILTGILLRIRSFLYLGVTFLVLDVMTMIWYAAVDLHQTWLWYACGVVLGAAIIALFAVFEKRRNDVTSAVERLKKWDE